jgi:hypothetical protein
MQGGRGHQRVNAGCADGGPPRRSFAASASNAQHNCSVSLAPAEENYVRIFTFNGDIMFRKLVVALAVSLFTAGAAYAGEWVRLGDRTVGFRNDYDTIHVGRHEGAFKRLKLLIRNNDIKLNSIKIFFGNGEVENVIFDRHIRAGGEAEIELPHGWHRGRVIRDVELHYHSRPDFRGQAVAELWGQEEERMAPGPMAMHGGHEWVRLGDRRVGFMNDRDAIHVGRREGRFTRLKLLIRGNDIKLNSIKIVFGNGEAEEVIFDRHIRDGGEAVIELPHGWREGRFIRDVELRYHSRPDFRGEAVAELWGQEG